MAIRTRSVDVHCERCKQIDSIDVNLGRHTIANRLRMTIAGLVLSPAGESIEPDDVDRNVTTHDFCRKCWSDFYRWKDNP